MRPYQVPVDLRVRDRPLDQLAQVLNDGVDTAHIREPHRRPLRQQSRPLIRRDTAAAAGRHRARGRMRMRRRATKLARVGGGATLLPRDGRTIAVAVAVAMATAAIVVVTMRRFA